MAPTSSSTSTRVSGAQFRLFQDTAGIDVVRALHLDLTGREVPASQPVLGRRLIVENLDLAARVAYRDEPPGWSPPAGVRTELAWTVADDPIPLLAMTVRFGWMVTQRLIRSKIVSWRRSAGSRCAIEWALSAQEGGLKGKLQYGRDRL